jgi:hypothetical protein
MAVLMDCRPLRLGSLPEIECNDNAEKWSVAEMEGKEMYLAGKHRRVM